MKAFRKHMNIKLSENFHLREFDCQCSEDRCFVTYIQDSVIDSLESTRKEIGEPLFVTSGNRCVSRNADPLINGAIHSGHIYGDAVDIVPFGGDLDKLERVARKWFKYVKRYNKHIHADNRLLKE